MHSDSVDVMLVSASLPNEVLFQKRILLRTNGIAQGFFPEEFLNQGCYIAVKHRNSVETWSKLPITITNNVYYNFTGPDQFPSVYTNSPPYSYYNHLTFSIFVSGYAYTDFYSSPVLDRGVCWSVSPNPTIDLAQSVSAGSGSGSISANITQLQYSTTYYVRAYATNSVGTSYSSTMTFTTGPNPCAGISIVTDVDQNSYNVVSIGSQCWMQENLRVIRYRNFELIPTAQDLGISWITTDSGACAANYSLPISGFATYYNWYAVV
ncbi:MAG: hypothetical protein ACKOW8_02060, partial [Flavobacteriales bacterium]